MIHLKFFEDDDGYNNTVHSFLCPHCNGLVEISLPASNYGMYSDHTTFQENEEICTLNSHLFNTDKEWNISSIEEYRKRLIKFYNSNEYKTILKQEILKSL